MNVDSVKAMVVIAASTALNLAGLNHIALPGDSPLPGHASPIQTGVRLAIAVAAWGAQGAVASIVIMMAACVFRDTLTLIHYPPLAGSASARAMETSTGIVTHRLMYNFNTAAAVVSAIGMMWCWVGGGHPIYSVHVLQNPADVDSPIVAYPSVLLFATIASISIDIPIGSPVANTNRMEVGELRARVTSYASLIEVAKRVTAVLVLFACAIPKIIAAALSLYAAREVAVVTTHLWKHVMEIIAKNKTASEAAAVNTAAPASPRAPAISPTNNKSE